MKKEIENFFTMLLVEGVKIVKKKVKLLELTSDPVFKAFMISERTNALKARMIHLITGLDEESLLKAEYQSIELPVHHKNGKTYKTDVIIKIGKDIVSLEMNLDYYPDLPTKNGQYLKKVAGESYESGETYDDRIIYQINFDCYDQYKRKKAVYRFQMMEVEDYFIDDENYKKYNINLDSIKKGCYTSNESEELINIFKLFTVKNDEELEGLRGEEYMNEAIDEIRRLCQEKNIIGLYDAEAVARKEMNSRLKYAKEQGYDSGYDSGYDEGKLEIARNMIKEKADVSFITKVTGLSKKQIINLN